MNCVTCLSKPFGTSDRGAKSPWNDVPKSRTDGTKVALLLRISWFGLRATRHTRDVGLRLIVERRNRTIVGRNGRDTGSVVVVDVIVIGDVVSRSTDLSSASRVDALVTRRTPNGSRGLADATIASRGTRDTGGLLLSLVLIRRVDFDSVVRPRVHGLAARLRSTTTLESTVVGIELLTVLERYLPLHLQLVLIRHQVHQQKGLVSDLLALVTAVLLDLESLQLGDVTGPSGLELAQSIEIAVLKEEIYDIEGFHDPAPLESRGL